MQGEQRGPCLQPAPAPGSPLRRRVLRLVRSLPPSLPRDLQQAGGCRRANLGVSSTFTCKLCAYGGGEAMTFASEGDKMT